MFDRTNGDTFNSDRNAVNAFIEAVNNPYSLEPANTDEISYSSGTLSADNFTIDSSHSVVVISGNGNVDFGLGLYDNIDLSHISSDEVIEQSFYSATNNAEAGVVFDPGNGERVFDYIALADGTSILFEGIDRLTFADGVQDFTLVPDDPAFAEQWNLHMMGVQNAWRFTQGTDDVLIGVQDTGLGIDANGGLHPDLRANETWFFDSGNGTGLFGNLSDDFVVTSSQANQINSHGTSVQGIIAAESNNGTGIAGINWNSDVYNIDVLDGNTGDLSLAEAAQASIDRADSQGQQLVVNLSIQTQSTFDALASDGADLAVVIANNPNVLFVIAAGNFGHEGQEGLSSPAVLAQDYDNVIAVGASWGTSDRDNNPTVPGTRIEYDDWGSQYGDGLTLMGPSEVFSTNATADGEFNYNLRFDGTSAAAPNVTGVASLVWSANPDLTAVEIKTILAETAYDLGAEDYDIFNGHGFVNADAAVRRAIAISRSNTVLN